jgi:two-component system OmpR family sensor kinase
VRTISLRTRLTLWYTLALLTALGLFAATVLWQQERLGLRRVDRELEALTATLSNLLREEVEELGDVHVAAREALETLTVAGRAAAIVDGHDGVVASRWHEVDDDHVPSMSGSRDTWTVDAPSGQWRVHRLPFASGTTALMLLEASPLSEVHQEQREVREAMAIGIPIVLLLAGSGGWWLAAIGLRPIRDMAAGAAQISLSGMEDLGGTGRDDELGQLARAFNALVARLRAALHTQRQFMADASHELRTPLSVIRTAAEVILSRERREDDEYREALGIVSGQARRAGRLVDDMLVLARADAGGYPLRPVDLYLDELVEECRRAVDLLATARCVTIRSSAASEIAFRGDEDLLRRLVLNILQNAVQHTPTGGCVAIDIHQDPEAVKIRVSDQGPGIPPADRRRIFDRFVQLDATRGAHGTGLGLPIARWIAEAHHGTLELERSGPGGSTFCVSLRPCG